LTSSGDKERIEPATIALAAALLLVTVVVFWPVGEFSFLGYDDNSNIAENPMIHGGLTLDGVIWAFTTGHGGNWDPLTWLTHMLDWQLFGSDPSGHHRTNLWLHAVNAVLLLLLLRRMTGRPYVSAIVAFLFALHPLHVSAVAWVSARKDVLSTLFWILTLWAYVRHVELPRLGRYLVVLFSFGLGLLAKPMLVTLPFVLLLLDAWPLKRTGRSLSRLIVEKLPLFALAAAVSVVTYRVQSAAGAVESLQGSSLLQRLSNAVVSYGFYIVKTLWPDGLATPYPFVEALPLWQIVGASLLLAAVSALVLPAWRRRPCLAVGWLWFVGTLVPVIGLVQIGAHARADRFTYVPMIGLLIMIVFGAEAMLRRSETRRRMGGIVAILAIAGCAMLTHLQLPHWRNTESLFRHALAVTRGNKVAHYNLALVLDRGGSVDEAIDHYREALRIVPGDFDARWNLANALLRSGRAQEAVPEFQRILDANPEAVEPMTKLAAILASLGNNDEAIRLAERAAQLSQRAEPMILNVLAVAYEQAGQSERALNVLCEALGVAGRSGQQDLAQQIGRRIGDRDCLSVRANGLESFAGTREDERWR